MTTALHHAEPHWRLVARIVEVTLGVRRLLTRFSVDDSFASSRLLQFTRELDVGRVREHLARITARGYAREQNLEAKLTLVLRDAGHPSQ